MGHRISWIRAGVVPYWEMTDMNALKTLALRLVRDEEGQDLIEYALLATFVSLVAIGGATILGTALDNWYSTVENRVETASSTAAS
jgi:pilus assembly protein Flp/PilA